MGGGFDAGGDSAIRVPKFTATFDGRANSTQSVPLTPPMPTEGWVTGVLSVRVHAVAYTGTGHALVIVENVIQTPDDPSIIFASTTFPASRDIVAGTSAPALFTDALSTPIGPMLRIVLQFQQGGTAGGSASTISLSIDLVGRTS